MRLTVFLLLTCSLAVAAAAGGASRADTPPAPGPVTASTFLLTGRGYGHGVGMSQYGALGFARAGKTSDEILAYYYPGTELGRAPVATIRVLLAEARPGVTISSPVPFQVKDAAGTTLDLDAGAVSVGPKLRFTVEGATQQLVGPLIFRPGTGGPLSLGRSPFRGRLQVSSTGTAVQVVDYVGLEQYVQGVVPGEMPSAWPSEALKAQAVAARSYALAARVPGRAFDVYGDVRSQVYGGISIETPAASQAVADTAGEVVLYGGKVATTFFSSSSGGRTADATEVLSKPVPYLVSEPDPYDSISPYHTWGPVALTGQKVTKALKAPAPVTDVVVSSAIGGRARIVVVRTALGDTTVTGRDIRAALGLRSTWFHVGVLSLTRPGAPVVYGGAATLRVLVHGVTGAQLSTLVGGVWQPVRAAPGGTLSVLVRPKVSTVYRLATSAGAGPTLRVPVAPRVTFDGGAGAILPALPGATAVLERQDGTAWDEVATADVGADGSFAFAGPLASGVYRVVVPAVSGFADGVSPLLTR